MSSLHEIIGKQQVEIEQLRASQAQLVNFLRELKAGDKSLDDFHIGPAIEQKQPEASLNGAVANGD